MITTFLFALFISFLISFIFTPLTIRFFKIRGWVENPQVKSQKTGNATALYPVPRGGGIPVFLGLAITSLIFLPLDSHLLSILLASLLTLIVGLVDDVRDLSPYLRLITNFLAAVIIIASGIGINFVSNPFGGVITFNTFPLIADLVAVFWIIWCTNTVGWAAGIEGQLPGFVSISAIIIGILGLRFSSDLTQWPVIILSACLAGAYLGFLPFNFFPQKIMPGYSGKSLAGFLLAVLSILSGAKLATLLLLLGIPMIDAIFVILRRLKNHRSPFLSDGTHLHHQLLKSGWSRPQIAIFYWLLTLVFGLISLALNSQQKFYVFLGLVVLFIGITLKFSRRI